MTLDGSYVVSGAGNFLVNGNVLLDGNTSINVNPSPAKPFKELQPASLVGEWFYMHNN